MLYLTSVRRFLALLILFAGLTPGLWWRAAPVAFSDELDLRITEVPLASPVKRKGVLGPFALEGVWHLESPHRHFGGFSALVAPGDGELMALSDRGWFLSFAPPGNKPRPPRLGQVFERHIAQKRERDIESATVDRQTGVFWFGLEYLNAISQHAFDHGKFRQLSRWSPPGMAEWDDNSGPEAMTRLADGRFVVLQEGRLFDTFDTDRQALLFKSDPARKAKGFAFTVVGPRHFSPTDMAPLPDGRVLILYRRIEWPFPARFAARLAVADPADIRKGKPWKVRQVAQLPSSLPTDNFEGLAVEPGKDGRFTAWIISDDNRAGFQRTLLWKLTADPAELVRPEKKARKPKPSRPPDSPERPGDKSQPGPDSSD